MERVDITVFDDLVRPECPGAAGPVIRPAVMKSLNEFLRVTKIWTEWVTDYGVFPGDDYVDLDVVAREIDPDALFCELCSVYDTTNDKEITEKSEASISVSDPRWRQRTGTPSHYIKDKTGSRLYLYPHPESETSFDFNMSVTLKLTALKVPAFLYHKWGEYIAAGAIARLMIRPKTPWTNTDLARYFYALFNSGVGNARILAAKPAVKMRNRAKRNAWLRG